MKHFTPQQSKSVRLSNSISIALIIFLSFLEALWGLNVVHANDPSTPISNKKTLLIDQSNPSVNLAPYIELRNIKTETASINNIIRSGHLFAENPYKTLNAGFVKGQLWLKIPFQVSDNNQSKQEEWFLNFGAPHLKYFKFYHFFNGELISNHDGDVLQKKNVNPSNSPGWILAVDIKPGNHAFFLEIESNAMIQSQVLLQTRKSLFERSNLTFLWYGLLIGFFAFLMAFNLIVYGLSREPAFFYSFALMLGVIAFEASYSGLGIKFLWPHATNLNDFMLRFSVGFLLSMLGLFICSYLDLYETQPKIAKTIYGIVVLVLFCSALPVYRYVPLLALVCLLAIPILSVVAIIFTNQRKVRGTLYLLGGFVMLTIFIALAFASSSGFIAKLNTIPTYFDIGMTIMALLMSVALANRLNDEKDLAQLAEHAARSKSAFLASMSHEIRTPMNGVLGMLNLISKGELSHQQRQYSEMAQSSAESLLTLINDILDFSKIEAGKLDLEQLEFDIILLLEESCESMAVKAQEKSLELVLDLSAIKSPMVIGDPSRLRQILTNLISNAIKFTAEGEIVIKAFLTPTTDKQSGHQYEQNNEIVELFCSVTDTGIGIPDNKAQELFQDFSQADASTTRKFGGTGLGLSIAKHLAELMLGKIGVSSEPGRGARFWFTAHFPVSEHQQRSQLNLSLKQQHILLLEPSVAAAQVFIRLMQYWQGDVTWRRAYSELATCIVENHAISHLLVNDESNNNENFVPPELVKLCRDRNVKIVLMTAITKELSKAELNKAGITSTLSKPIVQSRLFRHFKYSTDAGYIPSPSKVPIKTHTDIQTTKINTAAASIKILLVEDNLVNQQVALGILSELDLSPDFALHGQQALDILNDSDEQYDLILMDCQMPIMDGYETTQRIRDGDAGQQTRNIPIIAMTANAMKGDRDKCLNAGMTDYVSKPVDIEALCSTLAKYIDIPSEILNAIALEVESTSISQTTHSLAPQQLTEAEETKKSIAALILKEDEKPTWNKEAALKRVRGNHDFLCKTIEIFLEDTPPQISQLINFVENQQNNEAAKVAHAIKGVAANLNGEALFDLLTQMETAAMKDDSVQLKHLLPQLSTKFQALEDSMNKSLLGHSATQSPRH